MLYEHLTGSLRSNTSKVFSFLWFGAILSLQLYNCLKTHVSTLIRFPGYVVPPLMFPLFLRLRWSACPVLTTTMGSLQTVCCLLFTHSSGILVDPFPSLEPEPSHWTAEPATHLTHIYRAATMCRALCWIYGPKFPRICSLAIETHKSVYNR